MNKIFPWTLSVLLAGTVIVGSLALAEWEPQERETPRWFVTPPILEEDLMQDVTMQELCWLVLTDYEGGHTAAMYRVKEHEASGKDEGWYLPPKVLEAQKRSVWRKLQEAFDATFEQGNRWNR